MTKKNIGKLEKVLCHCKDCQNLSHNNVETIYEYLIIRQMDPIYINGFHHGERIIKDEVIREVNVSNAYNLFAATRYMDNKGVIPLKEIKDVDFSRLLEERSSFVSRLYQI